MSSLFCAMRKWVGIVAILCVVIVFILMALRTPTDEDMNQGAITPDIPAPGGPIVSFYKTKSSYVGVRLPEGMGYAFNIYKATSSMGPWRMMVGGFPAPLRVAQDRAFPSEGGIVYYKLSFVDEYGNEGPSSAASNIVIEP